MGDNSKLPVSIDWPYEKDIGQAIEIANAWLERLLGPVATEVGELFADQVRDFRTRRALRVVLESHRRLSERGVSNPRPIPPTVLIPALEAASLETDAELSERWVRLLTNAADPTSDVNVRASFPRILAELTSLEAKILDWMYTSGFHSDSLEQFYSRATYRQVLGICEGLHILEFKVVVSNLCRLGLSSPRHNTSPASYAAVGDTAQRYDELDLSPFGAEFVRACHVPMLDKAPPGVDDTETGNAEKDEG